MPELQHRPATAPEATAPAVTSPNPGFGIGANELNEGVRTLPDGSQTYGRDVSGDPLTMLTRQLDRAMAMAELSSKFNVVSDDFVGPRLGNQVTQSEFARIATLYSDVRMGDTNLQFDTAGMSEQDANAFRSGAMGDIGTLLTTASGRDLIDQLAYQQVDGHDNTTTLRRSATPGQAGTNSGPGGNFANGANGVGTNTAVSYQPGVDFDMATQLSPNYQTSGYRNITSDIVLFHELVHANHMRQGLADMSTITNREATHRNDRGVLAEEYATVGLGGYGEGDLTENGYRRERAFVTGQAIPQRDTYNGSGPTPTRRRRRP